MYTHVKSLVKDLGRQGRWSEIDSSNITLMDLWEGYDTVYLILSHPSLSDVVMYDLTAARISINSTEYFKTVSQWLIDNGIKTLNTVTEIPSIEPRYVTYGDAIQCGYNIRPIDRTVNISNELPLSELEDLWLTKEGLDYELFNKFGLVTVNGLIHLTDVGVYGVHVVDGHISKMVSNDTLVGIMNFSNVGELTRVPITRDMVAPATGGATLKDYADINLDMDLKDKTVFVVIGGYLHAIDNNVTQLSDNIYRVNFNNLPIIARFYESRDLIDLSSLTEIMTKKNGNYNQLDMTEVYSDEWLIRYLTLSQSFFLVIDSPEVFVDKDELVNLPVPGRYVSDVRPEWPVSYGLGAMLDYFSTEEYGRWLIAGQRAERVNYNYKTTQWKYDISLDNTRSTINPFEIPPAHYLKIGTVK